MIYVQVEGHDSIDLNIGWLTSDYELYYLDTSSDTENLKAELYNVSIYR